MKLRAALLVSLVFWVGGAACGGSRASSVRTSTPQTPVVERTADWLVPLLPEGAQVVVEIDLARLRANKVIGDVIAKVLGELGADARLPGLPIVVQGSPLGDADALALGAYGVGTAQAATVVLLVTKSEVAGGVRVASDIVALGPEDWVDQVASRAAIAKLVPDLPAPVGARATLTSGDELARLRDHALPDGAPGASLRVTARLPFDARIAFARLVGVDSAPAQVSVWGDVVDDLAIVIDADAADPGDKNAKSARARIAAALGRVLAAIAAEPSIRSIGVANNIANPRVVEQNTWVRAIITVSPRQLARAAERARKQLGPPPPAAAPAPSGE